MSEDRDAPSMTSGADHNLDPSGQGAPPGDQMEQDQIWMRGYGLGLTMGMAVGSGLTWLRDRKRGIWHG